MQTDIASEEDPQSKLSDARGLRSRNLPVIHIPNGRIRRIVIRVIEGVEELADELDCVPLRKLEVAKDGKIPVVDARPVQWEPRCVPKRKLRSGDECVGIEVPLCSSFRPAEG